MAPKKTKKTADSINSRLALVMKSGKVTLGAKSTLKSLRSGKYVQQNSSEEWKETYTHKGQASNHCWQHSSPQEVRT